MAFSTEFFGFSQEIKPSMAKVARYALALPWGLGFGVWGLGFGVWGLGFGVWGLGFGVWGLGFGVWGLGFGVWGLGFGVWGLGFGVWGLGFGVWGLGFGVKAYPLNRRPLLLSAVSRVRKRMRVLGNLP